MTVSAQTPINRSTGNGVTTVFPYTFKIISDADIEVTVDDVVKTLNVDYTVSGAGVDAGGNVTMTGAPANATSVVRRRNMALVRSTDYQDQGELPATTLDNDIDATVLMVQQLDERLDRTFSLPASFSGDSTLPAPEPGYLIGWDATGENLTNIPASVGSSLVDIAAPSGSSLVGFIQAGTGAVATTAQTKLRESVSVKDFGAVFDGVTDDTAAIQAAIDYAASLYTVASGYPRGGISVKLPSGVGKSSGLVLKNGVSLRGTGIYKTLILMAANGGTLFKNASATTQVSADQVSWCEYSDFSFIPDPATTFSAPTVLWNMTGFSRCVWRNIGTAFKGNVTAWQLIGATLASSGGPSNWYNDFYSVFTEGMETGGIGWDLGDTLATKEQITTWNWYSGRTSGNSGTGTGMKLNSATGCNLYSHVFESLSDELIIGSAAGTRGCLAVNLLGCYFEGSSNGYTVHQNAINTGFIKCFATGVTNTDNGTRTTIINDGETKFPVANVTGAYRLLQTDLATKPEVSGSTGPGWRLKNEAGNWLDIWNGAATSSATDYLRVDDVAGRTLLKSGAAGTQLYGSQLSLGNQSTVSIFIGSGSPEGVVSAAPGSIFMRTNGGSNTSMYVKESGTGNSGWIAK